MATQQSRSETIIIPSVLGYELNTRQNVIANYLIPCVSACVLYILQFACDIAVAYRHIHENNPVWGFLTIFFMYLPVLGCCILTISSWEFWPHEEGCGSNNIKWCLLKVAEHIFFPIWSMWRFAEKIFWSIEGIRTTDEEERDSMVKTLCEPRTIELYFFLQAYLQSAPQLLLQLHILMRFVQDMEKATVDAMGYCIVLSIMKMATTTTLFQRFKSQKLTGKCYPWFKPYKLYYDQTIDTTDREPSQRVSVVYKARPVVQIRDSQNQSITLRQHDKEPSEPASSRRSSDYYEQPTDSYIERMKLQSVVEYERETSVVGGPKRLVLRDDDITETDYFMPRRLREIKGLPEDDVAGKAVAFLWWFCFLLARMLAISSFGYFYSSEIIWLLSSHFILVVALLLYDVRADEVRRAKAIFFIFIGFVYLFCLIEFKIKFKKVKFIYNGFFTLMFLENFSMVFVWWFRNMEDILNDWWYKYIFYTVVVCTLLSLVSMLLYVNILKPKKIVVDVVPQTT